MLGVQRRCEFKVCLRLLHMTSAAGIKPQTPWSRVQRLNHSATRSTHFITKSLLVTSMIFISHLHPIDMQQRALSWLGVRVWGGGIEHRKAIKAWDIVLLRVLFPGDSLLILVYLDTEWETKQKTTNFQGEKNCYTGMCWSNYWGLFPICSRIPWRGKINNST